MAEAAHDLWHRRRIVVFLHQPNRLPWDFALDGLSRSQASVYFFLKRSCVLLNRVRKTAARRILGGSRVAAVVVAVDERRFATSVGSHAGQGYVDEGTVFFIG